MLNNFSKMGSLIFVMTFFRMKYKKVDLCETA